MKSLYKKKTLAAMALVALLAPLVAAQADDTAAEIRALKEQLKLLQPLKARLKQLEEKVAKQDRAQKETQAKLRQGAVAPPPPGMVCKDAPCPPPPPPVFVSFANGLKVESWDHDFSFKIGGYIFVDGGLSTEPETGKAGTVNLSRARLQVEGKAFSYWLYKLQYEFAGNTSTGTVGGSSTVEGGIRDAYLALKYPGLAVVPFTSAPLVLQLGNFYEPMGLERTNSLLYADFIYRAMPSDALTPSRHIGIAALAHGDSWSAKGGIFSTSPEDRALAPPAGTPAFPFPTSAVATGGGQYFDLSGRITYAPIMEKGALLHFGGSARYQRPNDSTGGNDNRVMLLGSNVQTEANVLGENLLGTPDLSCGTIFTGARAVAGKCVSDLVDYGAEFVAAYGPFSVQGEYMGAHYNRDAGALLFARANGAGINSVGGTSLNFSRHSPDDTGSDRQIGMTWPFWRSPPPPPMQLNPLQSITFQSVTKIVELIVIKTHLSREFGSNA